MLMNFQAIGHPLYHLYILPSLGAAEQCKVSLETTRAWSAQLTVVTGCLTGWSHVRLLLGQSQRKPKSFWRNCQGVNMKP